MDEFLKQLLTAVKEGGGKISEMRAADLQRQVCVDSMGDVIKVAMQIKDDEYSKVDETTHALLSLTTALLEQQVSLLRVLIERMPPKTDGHLPPKPKPNGSFPPFAAPLGDPL